MALLTIALILLACGPTPPPQTATTIRLGVLYNLTGSQARLDRPSANGAALAAEKINAAGGVLGRRLELIPVDGKTDAAAIRAAAIHLVETEKVVAMLGFSDSEMVLAAAPIAAKAGIVFVTSGATSAKLPAQVPDYLFLACFGDNVQAAAAAEYAYRTLQARSVYLLADQGMEYTRLLGKYFTERFTSLGGRVLLQDTYQSGGKDLAPQLARLKGLARLPDVLYVAAGPEDVGAIVKQLRAAGVSKPIFGGDSYATPALLDAAGKSTGQTYFTTHVLIDPQLSNRVVNEFINAYQAKYGIPPENAFAGLGYDAVELLADAITRAGSADPQAIRAALQNTRDLQGVTGSIAFQPGSRIPQKSVALVWVTHGRFTLASEFVPEQVPAP